MTVLLLEDETPAADRLRRLLTQADPTAQVLAVLDTVAGALAWLDTHPAPDLILSDIQLADGLSLDVFAQTVVRSPVIFTTAYDQYALRAFEANSVAYLLKPVKLPDLQAALAKLRHFGGGYEGKGVGVEEGVAGRAEPPTNPSSTPTALPSYPKNSYPKNAYPEALERLLDALPRPQRPHKERFLVRQGEALLPLPALEAAWFQSRHEVTTLATLDGRRFVVDYTLEELEKLLDPARFCRLNRQVLAQLPAVRRLLPYLGGKLLVELLPAPSGEVLVSKERAGTVKAWLEG